MLDKEKCKKGKQKKIKNPIKYFFLINVIFGQEGSR